jgi:multiple sugar transport system substrate-binding protein
MPEFNLQAFLDETAYAVPYPVSANTPVWNEFEMTDLTPAWELTEPLREAAAKLAGDMNSALAQE